MDSLRDPVVLLTDLDNTLYDWVGYWVPAFRAMAVSISKMSGIPLGALMEDFAAVFRRHKSVEYSFVLEELETLRVAHPDLTPTERVKLYWPAVEEFQIMRRRLLRPYQGVQELLAQLQQAGVKIIGVTEGAGFHVRGRLKQLNVASHFSAVYTVPDHDVPEGLDLSQIRRHPLHTYQAEVEIRYIPEVFRKPNPALLDYVLRDIKITPSQAVYLGDGLHRDIQMAQQCEVFAIWAKYGTFIDPYDWRTLLRVTNWSQEDVVKTSERLAVQCVPDLIAESPLDVLVPFRKRLHPNVVTSTLVGMGQSSL